MKKCTKCGETKPLSEFFNSKRKCGKKPACKECCKKYNSERYKLKKDHILSVNRAYSKAHPEIVKKKQDNYAKAHPDRIRLKRRKRYRKDDHIKEYSKANFKSRRDRITDGYVSHVLKSRNFTSDQITPDLIAAHRMVIKIKRAVKEMT